MKDTSETLRGIFLFFHLYCSHHNALAVHAIFIFDVKISVGQKCSALILCQPGGVVAAGGNGSIQCAVHQPDGILPDRAAGIIGGADIQAGAAVGRQSNAAAQGKCLGINAAVVEFLRLGPGAASVCGAADIAGDTVLRLVFGNVLCRDAAPGLTVIF